MRNHAAVRMGSALGVLAVAAILFAVAPHALGAESIVVKEMAGKVRVELNGELFTEYLYQGFAKPILYPIIGPYGIGMTRNYPMRDVRGEARDHVHQKSLWFTHGNVNGVDFWAEGEKCGRIVHDKLLKAAVEDGRAVIRATNKWVRPNGDEVCSDTRRISIFTVPGARILDFEILISASKGDVVFGDTKEGTMGIRSHPTLQLTGDPRSGVSSANGKAVNSEGVRDKDIWGKRAKWVDYWAPIEGKILGIAVFDHPENPRHPTWWHARDYGLIAANPFGIHDFEKKPANVGDFKIPAGESKLWRYRFVFHEGDAEQAKIAALYADFAATKATAEAQCCAGMNPACAGCPNAVRAQAASTGATGGSR